MSLVKKDPLRDLLVIQEQINKVFEDRLNSFPAGEERLGAVPLPVAGSFQPPLDVYETGEALVIEAELPGVAENDVQVKIEGGILTLRGERKMPAGPRVTKRSRGTDRYHRMERQFGTFARAFTLPPSVDSFSLETHFQDGILRVTLSKKAPKGASQKKNL